MHGIEVGGPHLAITDVVRIARDGVPVRLAAGGLERARLGRAVVERYAAGDEPVYGINTGLGGNVGYRLSAAEISSFQRQLVRGRSVAVGEPLDDGVSRAAMAIRAHGLCRGGGGAAPAVIELLVAMLNRGVTPVLRRHGSIGAGDLCIAAGMGAVVFGGGEARFRGRSMPGGEALAAAGLAAVEPGPKDGLALINTSAVGAALACLALADLGHWVETGTASAALAFEGYAGNVRILDPRLAAARPARGQVQAAERLRELLAGSALHDPGVARSVQDAISFRCLPQILGTLLATLELAREDLRTEIDGAADNAMVLVEDGEMLSSGNFHTTLLALAFDSLAIALSSHAAALAQRVLKLMNPALSGLPRYLSPVGGASCGLVPLQKTVAALLGGIRHLANPASLDAIPVSDAVEDHAPQTPLAVGRLAEQTERLAWLTAIEALVAAQAVDLRGLARLGEGTAPLHARVRAVSPPLVDDRETGEDVSRVRVALAGRPGAA